MPRFVRHLQQKAVLGDSGVVDQNIEPPELCHNHVHGELGVSGRTHVARDFHRPAPCPFDLCHRVGWRLGRQAPHCRSFRSKTDSDRSADSPAGPRYERNFAFEPHPTASTTASRSLGSRRGTAFTSGAIRLISPHKTSPGPHSMNSSIPDSTMLLTLCDHLTADASCLSSSPGQERGSGSNCPVTLLQIGISGCENCTSRKDSAKRRAESAINGL